MRFRPCIDLYEGRVTQIVGGSLRDGDTRGPVTHFRSERSPADYARTYREDGLPGGHVIVLGPDEVARGHAVVRNMASGEEREVPLEDLE